jgi:hypothetical protein
MVGAVWAVDGLVSVGTVATRQLSTVGILTKMILMI